MYVEEISRNTILRVYLRFTNYARTTTPETSSNGFRFDLQFNM